MTRNKNTKLRPVSGGDAILPWLRQSGATRPRFAFDPTAPQCCVVSCRTKISQELFEAQVAAVLTYPGQPGGPGIHAANLVLVSPSKPLAVMLIGDNANQWAGFVVHALRTLNVTAEERAHSFKTPDAERWLPACLVAAQFYISASPIGERWKAAALSAQTKMSISEAAFQVDPIGLRLPRPSWHVQLRGYTGYTVVRALDRGEALRLVMFANRVRSIKRLDSPPRVGVAEELEDHTKLRMSPIVKRALQGRTRRKKKRRGPESLLPYDEPGPRPVTKWTLHRPRRTGPFGQQRRKRD